MEWTKLLGLLVIVAGFALRLNTLAIVLAAGLATGLIAGMGVNDVIAEFGRAFAEGSYKINMPVTSALTFSRQTRCSIPKLLQLKQLSTETSK